MRSDRWLGIATILAWTTAAIAQPPTPAPTTPAPTTSEPATPEPTTPAPTTPAPSPAPTTSRPAAPPAPRASTKNDRKRGLYVGIEVGVADIGDDRNMYGDGRGKTLVLGIGTIELRLFEYYALEDRSDMFGNAEGARGELGLSSLGARISMIEVGPLRVSALLGFAYVRRSHLRTDVDGFEDSISSRLQRGLGLQGGVGVSLGGYLHAEARAYPTLWSDLEGDSRMVVDDNGAQMIELITDSPGGMPMTFSIGLGVPF